MRRETLSHAKDAWNKMPGALLRAFSRESNVRGLTQKEMCGEGRI